MKKYLMLGVVGLALSTSVQAVTSEEFEEALNEWEKTYPVLKQVREEDHFQCIANISINNYKEYRTALQIFKLTLRGVMPIYKEKMDNESQEDNKENICRINKEKNSNFNYSKLVKDLKPLYEDLFRLTPRDNTRGSIFPSEEPDSDDESNVDEGCA